MIKIQRALISVYDKQGLPELLRALQAFQCNFVSTGGTARAILESGASCEKVEDVTGFPEILDGRVKTLHPAIFGGILNRGNDNDLSELKKHKITPLQLVVVNLYPFAEEQKKEKADDLSHMLEYIDIGGVALLRAAAKSHPHCVVLSHPRQYKSFIDLLNQHAGTIPVEASAGFAIEAFQQTSAYDQLIAQHLHSSYKAGSSGFPEQLNISLKKIEDLAYGENPHQRAALFSDGTLALQPQQLAGKPLSYNNIIDVDGCLGVLSDFLDQSSCVIIKHSNPCGVGVTASEPLLQAYERALECDPLSAFGGIVGFSRTVDAPTAEVLAKKFYEIIIAPDFSPDAVTMLAKKPKLRLLKIDMHGNRQSFGGQTLRHTFCGYLYQDRDTAMEDAKQAKIVSKRHPKPAELAAMQMAWRVCKWVKSNAIVIANAHQTVGIGAGQMSRVDSVELAIKKATLPLAGCALASDAFFPFRDSIDRAKQAGIELIVQPGGSMRDEEVIQAANEHGMVMLFTGVRHFRH